MREAAKAAFAPAGEGIWAFGWRWSARAPSAWANGCPPLCGKGGIGSPVRRHIHTAGQQLLSLLDQALEYAKLDDKPLGIRLDSGDLAFLSRGARGMFRDVSARAGVDCPFPGRGDDGVDGLVH